MPTSSLPRPLLLMSGAIAAAALVAGATAPANADPVGLTVAATASVVTLPVGDGYQDAESLVVTASAATTATVTLQRAGGDAAVVAQDLALVAGPSTVTVPTAGLAAGAYTATVTTTDGASAAAGFAVEPLVATVTRLAVQRSVSTVYPVKDGYRDSVELTVTPTVTGPSTVAVTGTARLTRAGRTAKSWKLHGGTNRLTWNGRTGGAVVPGRYTLTVSAKGPQGAARTARVSVAVSPKRLVTRTVTSTSDASIAFTRYQAYDGTGNAGQCGFVLAAVLCRSATAVSGSPFAIVVGGSTSVPKAVRSSSVLGKPELRVALRTTALSGRGTWGYGVGTVHTTRSIAQGTTTGKWLRWTGPASSTTIYLGLDDDTRLAVDRVTVSYRYLALD